ncbi:putative baseplate assembly protein [Methylomonas sp. MgM2]
MSQCDSVVVCKDERRRDQVRLHQKYNGLDYIEVSDDQLTLSVYFLGKAPLILEKENIRIEGGRRINDIQVLALDIHREEDPETDDCVHIRVDKAGDFSTYCLCVIEIDPLTKKPIVDVDEQGRKHYRPMAEFDSRYACLEFNFKVGCASDLDCKQQPGCPETPYQEPDIDYLAKDYASFRQLILDRLALLMPDWTERHVPDIGITLVELLAYVGDHLSYYQDAVATEAYLETARQRISVRRHVRLVDYYLHEGCNARTWVCIHVVGDLTGVDPNDVYFITNPGVSTLGTILAESQLPTSFPLPYLIFEPLVDDRSRKLNFYESRNEIRLYTWGDTQCCLPKGSTSVTLIDPGEATQATPDEDEDCGHDDHPKPPYDSIDVIPPQDSDYKLDLKICDILILEEVKGPKTGNRADADPSHRQAVRLIKAQRNQDPLTGQLLWDVEWGPEDALVFPLCISAINPVDCSLINNVSVVCGNVLLVDHGKTVTETLDPVPCVTVESECEDACLPRETVKISGPFNPTLAKTDITFCESILTCITDIPCPPFIGLISARKQLQQHPNRARPQVTLTEITAESDTANRMPINTWEPRVDLLASGPHDPHFSVEIQNDRHAKLRFGNGETGLSPKPDTRFQVKYRIGNGPVGNVGAESITRMVFSNNFPSGVDITLRNPLPAVGGTEPETLAEAKLYAPHMFRKELHRAITADDYAQIVMRDFSNRVQRARAKLLWTGSWFQVLVVIDPIGTEQVDEVLLCEIRHHLCRFHRIGHDVVVVQASYVALDIAIKVCVLPHFLRGHVKSELLDVFSDRILPNGHKGFFHPDNLSFGEGVYLSQLVSVAQAVEGVESVVVAKLERLFEGPDLEIENGLLRLDAFEIARLDNDPSFPENGRFTLEMGGGR